MRDLTTSELIDTLVLKVRREAIIGAVQKLIPSHGVGAAFRKAERERRDAERALDKHLEACLKEIERSKLKKPAPRPQNFKLTGRTINALKNYRIFQPETCTVEELLRIPGVGAQGVAAIAQRSYIRHSNEPVHWPELHR